MTMKRHTRIDLVEGGNIFKQGEHVKLSYAPRDSNGDTVDLSDKDISVVIWNRKGVMYEGSASYDVDDELIRMMIEETLAHGEFNIEFTATSSTDPSYRQKFPSSEYEGRLLITPSAENMDVVGVQMTTVAQLKADQKADQEVFEAAVIPRVETVENQQAQLAADYQTATAAMTVDSEVVLARKGEPTLGAFNDKVTAQLADKANGLVYRDKGGNIIAGYSGNTVADGVFSSNILGGGGANGQENVLGGDTSTVGTATPNAPIAGTNTYLSRILGGYDQVVNGITNQSSADHSYIQTGASHSSIMGGANHGILAGSDYSSINGGIGNIINGDTGVISGGNRNKLTGNNITIAGGTNNEATADGATVGGGTGNIASGVNAAIAGGGYNTATGQSASVIGGLKNQATGIYSSANGGTENKAIGTNSTVSGGAYNSASTQNSVVSGGLTNLANGIASAVTGGTDNKATGNYSAVVGGQFNEATGTHSVAQGSYAKARFANEVAFGAGRFVETGDAQRSDLLNKIQTTNGTQVSVLSATPNPNTTWGIKGTVTARRIDADGESAMWEFKFLIDRPATGVGTIVGTPVITEIGKSVAALYTFEILHQYGTLHLKVKGEDGKTVNWISHIEITQLIG